MKFYRFLNSSDLFSTEHKFNDGDLIYTSDDGYFYIKNKDGFLRFKGTQMSEDQLKLDLENSSLFQVSRYKRINSGGKL